MFIEKLSWLSFSSSILCLKRVQSLDWSHQMPLANYLTAKQYTLANTKHWTNADLMLPNIKSALG